MAHGFGSLAHNTGHSPAAARRCQIRRDGVTLGLRLRGTPKLRKTLRRFGFVVEENYGFAGLYLLGSGRAG